VQARSLRSVLLPRFNVGRLAYEAILVNNFMFPNIKKDEISRTTPCAKSLRKK
jgi:hypothetical protein